MSISTIAALKFGCLSFKTIIGIDPGVKTGYACKIDGKIIYAVTLTIWQLFEQIDAPGYGVPKEDVLFVVEDARKRSGGFASAQGAGWVKTLSGQIEAFLKQKGHNYKMIAPIRHGTKLTAKQIETITGFDERTNEHERDAIMIAWHSK